MRNEYLIWCPEDGDFEDEALHVKAGDVTEAVKNWAERVDEDFDDDHVRYRIAKGYSVRVRVRDCQTGTVSKWVVGGDFIPQQVSYFCTRIDE